ncbi:MAG: hypothetical protein JWM38_220 [Sphingomonas bacterium]|nr:hypothetical protein [Sphingomonas bacterium]
MDNAHSLDRISEASDYPDAREPQMEPPPAIGTDERRMHVRAYNFWVSLLHGRALPPIDALDPASLPDFGPHGVLLDFSDGPEDPQIAFLGSALRAEGSIDGEIARISDVPGRSLLSRLTDHYLQILANRAPIGFEAEFTNVRGNNTLYRGILMPFASDGETIDHVYGVIGWKELADSNTTTVLALEVKASLAANPAPQLTRPPSLWADGPGSRPEAGEAIAAEERAARSRQILEPSPDDTPCTAKTGLAECLAAARSTASLLRGADIRSRSALYRALGLAYDFALAAARHPGEWRSMLAAAGIRAQKRAPMTAVVKLVFGADYDKARLTEFAAVLAYGQRLGLEAGGMRRMLEAQEGGLKAVVAAERKVRHPLDDRPRSDPARDAMRGASAQGFVDLATGDAEFVLLLARREDAGRVAVIGTVGDDEAMLGRAIRRLSR